MKGIEERYDIIIVGAGHAGCEAALACARLGFSTIMFTVSVDSIALMPCNPNIGGTSKGHLVRELDALGGEMGKNIDKTFIQSRMLNMSKGPAVHSLRAQADKREYTGEMRKTLENTKGLTIRQAEVSELIVKDGRIRGVKTVSGAKYLAEAVILCTGVYLKARCIYGEVSENTGPNGLKAANYLSQSLIDNGIELRRFKTGTPARVDRRSLDFSRMTEQKGDVPVVPFSFSTDPADIQKEQVSCYLTYTTLETHEIIRENIDRSPLFSGEIEGVGPRYCPSIEDKVIKFPEKDRHQIFVEPEGLYTNEMYLSGMSSSLPEDVQYAMYRTMIGLENVRIVRNAYAIEYDCIDATQLKATLEFKKIKRLYGAGQINGSSGYEEAAVQGFMAAVNACRDIQGKDPIILDRSQAYIGVLIDDLVTKENVEPYRMMTSRAEYRLLLRQDNADLRLSGIGYEIGLVSRKMYERVLKKKQQITAECDRLKTTVVGANERIQSFLEKHGSSPLKTGTSLAELICRPELTYELTAEIDPGRNFCKKNRRDDNSCLLSEAVCSEDLLPGVSEQINIEIKYEGYIARQQKMVDEFRRVESRKLWDGIDYEKIGGLRLEAGQKLNRFKPHSVGQASRISGVTPADIAVLLVWLKKEGS